ncbi:nose resistant to fluoxetine protein 6-like [Eupeodes corollae]|uniref:nose resistant to fluoxetine protein 6-like n=1 Tax=Eupeodes corollae TaxID=290404 RepID=UPI002491B569|nr:nose resistant to fluoxetine protein 6-like [Eupeodes corollae]
MRFSLFLIISIVTLLTNRVDSLTFVHNISVNSDFLSEVFYNEIRSNQELIKLENTRNFTADYNTEKCVSNLRTIVTQLPTHITVAPFFDSWGNLPPGILYGNTYDVGNYDQCIQTSVTLDESNEVVNGQHCFVKIPIREKNNQTVPAIKELSLKIGICVPKSCSPDFIQSIFNSTLKKVYDGKLPSNVTVSLCKTSDPPTWKAINIIGVCFFGLIGIMMLASTIYDLTMTTMKTKPTPVLLAFSVLTNGKKMFAISTKKSPNIIDCLTGIRVLSMAWIMYGHTYMISFQVPFINDNYAQEWKKSFSYLHVANGTLAVDSFFFLGGLLVAWSGFKELDRTKGKLNIIMMYVHRYIRLTPLVAVIMLILYSVKDILGEGPFKEGVNGGDICNGHNWWPNLLYIQNYYIPNPKCLARSWYLAVDFQLYVISPFLMIPMWKWGKKFAPVILGLVLMSIAYIMTVYITHSFTDLKGGNPGEWNLTYIPMHTRCSPWLVGFGLGYFMHVNRQREFRLHKMLQLLGWVVCFLIMISTVFGPYFSLNAHGKGTVIETALYDAWKRPVWALALAWITFACHYGFGGFLDVFLSHPFWQPFARLTYAMYLTHAMVIRFNASLSRLPGYFSTYDEILRFWSAFGMTVLFSILMSLAFEAPILVLEKFIFGKDKPAKPQPVEPETSKNKIQVP